MYPMIFSPFSRPGMNFSFSTYEMTNGSLQSSMNCLMNQAWADMSARRELYFYPQYSFNNFSQYQNVFSNNYLTDINYTLGQYHFNSLANGGQGLYGWNAVPTFNNNGNQWGCGWTPWGWQGSNGGSQAGSSSDKDNEFRADYESLKTLLETYRDKGNVGKSIKTKINEAINTSGSYEERLDALKAVYKKISNKDNIKKVIAFLPEYKTELENAGYKMSSIDVANIVTAVENDIKDIKDSKDEYTGSDDGFRKIESLATLDDGSANNILAIISKWNDTHKGNETCIVGAVLAKTNDRNKDNNYKYFVDPLVSALKNKAEQVKDNCDETTIKNIDKVVSELTKAVDGKNNANVTTNFKKLYVMLRDIEAKRINRDIQDEYKFLNDIADDDTDIINNNLIIDSTKADLKAEDLETDYNKIKDDIALNKRDEIVGEGDDDNDGDRTTADKMGSLVLDGTLITNGTTATGETIYEETTVAEGATKRQFIIKDEKVRVYNNGVVGEEVTPESIKAAKKAVEDANAAAAAQAEQEEAAIQEQKDIKVTGREFAIALRNEKTSGKLSSAKDCIEKVNENNVMEFLNGVYSVKEKPLNGYFERMDKRNDGTITMENQRNLIKAVLDKAKKAGLESSNYYTKLEALYKRYQDGALKNENNFDHRNKTERKWGNWKDKATSVWTTASTGAAVGAGIGVWLGGPVGAVVGGVVGFLVGMFSGAGWGEITDAEVIDDCIRNLYNEIKEKENGTLS